MCPTCGKHTDIEAQEGAICAECHHVVHYTCLVQQSNTGVDIITSCSMHNLVYFHFYPPSPSSSFPFSFSSPPLPSLSSPSFPSASFPSHPLPFTSLPPSFPIILFYTFNHKNLLTTYLRLGTNLHKMHMSFNKN